MIGCCGFEGGSRCLSGWMSCLVVFEDGWCFTWNVGNACNEIPRVYGHALQKMLDLIPYIFKIHAVCCSRWVCCVRMGEC